MGGAAIAAGNKIIRDRGISVVYTSAPPYSSLASRQGTAEARSPVGCRFPRPIGIYSKISQRYAPCLSTSQRDTVNDALRTGGCRHRTGTPVTAVFIRDIFGNEHTDPIFIPTGIDEGLREPRSRDLATRTPYLIFAGEYLPEYETTFLEAFE